MKRFFGIAVTAAIILSLCSCGSSNSSSSSIASSSGSMAESSGAISDSMSGSSLAGNYENSGLRLGLGFDTSTAGSTAAASDANGNARFDVTVCALTVDSSGTIVDVVFDAITSDVGFDAAGAFTGDIAGEIKTRRELGDDYGLAETSDIGKEWYEQVDAFQDWMNGKTVSEVLSMKVADGDESGHNIPDEDDLRDSITISVSPHLRALEKAYANAMS